MISKKLLCSIPGYDPFRDSKGFYFDHEEAEARIWFIETYLRHQKGELFAGKTFQLALWQKAIVANLFGWKSKKTGYRRYKTLFLYVPRKNGKSTLCAAIALCVFFMDKEPGAELYSVAADAEQAKIIFNIAKGMIEAEPNLHDRVKIYTRSISLYDDSAIYTVVSAKHTTKHGANVHGVFIDELHAQPNRDLVDAYETAMGARTQPIEVLVTTSDILRPSICNEKYEYAKQVRDGVIRVSHFLPVVYEATKEDDWKSPKVWKRVNPSFGISVQKKFFEEEFEKAKHAPSFLNSALRLYLNIRTEQAEKWIPMDVWSRCGITSDESPIEWRKRMIVELKGAEPCAAIDLASISDFNCLSLVFCREKDMIVLPYYWIPGRSILEREKKGIPIRQWIREGFAYDTGEEVTNYDRIRDDINKLWDYYGFEKLVVDKHFQGAQLCSQLADDGIEIISFPSSFGAFTQPTKELERLVIGGIIQHGDNPILTWNTMNVSLERNHAEEVRPSKKFSSEKIDGTVATIMSIGLAQATSDDSSIGGYLFL